MDHNLYIVLLSLLVCFLFVLVSLEWILRRTDQQKTPQRFLILGSVTMGIAVWATHYMGMLSIQSPIPFLYDLTTMSISLAVSFLFSYVSFFLLHYTVQRQQNKLWAPVFTFGTGLLFVHTIGVLSMHIHPVQTDAWWISLSIGSAFLFTWIAFLTLIKSGNRYKKITVSLSLTTGVSLMHYIGEMALVGGTPTFNCIMNFRYRTLIY
ncbi:hypothetical protein KUV80_10400 [Fictibacillus nanhaiensis]|uniref:MHYT domain-containing protein n=1 Tax=Fictibacillus nanhaiensis TaxID=742169 RepID=UPI001C968C44|nr:MHYT domain-containing protein [Fictibacillus nanhaiensis]MBY6037069.1 hypothetical protein [Fictibacillus nanhaiensis]